MRNRLPIALGLLLIEGVYMKYIHGAVGATNVLSTRQAFSIRKKNHRKKWRKDDLKRNGGKDGTK